MKKFINRPEPFVDEMLEGVLCAHPLQLEGLADCARALVKKNRSKKKVALVAGGGSGHLPLFLGYVGDGSWTVAGEGKDHAGCAVPSGAGSGSQ